MPSATPSVSPGKAAMFASLKQVDAGALRVSYAEAGPSDGPAVLLLHGWPYDIHSFVEVAPLLAAAGHRAFVYSSMVIRRAHREARILTNKDTDPSARQECIN
jgi:hypothetical protein